MIFTVPCHIFARAAKAALQPDKPDGVPSFSAIRSVRVEHYQGVAMAIATNRRIMVVEYIGPTEQPDGAINVSLDLAAACQQRADTDLNLMITQAPGWSVGQIGVDYFHPNNAEVVGEFPNWRALIPKPVRSSNGALGLSAEELALLAEISPTGGFVLPTHYDSEQPILVRDYKDDGWIGLFLALEHRGQTFKPAVLPGWWKP